MLHTKRNSSRLMRTLYPLQEPVLYTPEYQSQMASLVAGLKCLKRRKIYDIR